MMEEIRLGVVADILRDAGYECSIEQTGGGTATIIVGDIEADTEETFAIGPGYYVWANPKESYAYSEELSFGMGTELGGQWRDGDTEETFAARVMRAIPDRFKTR